MIFPLPKPKLGALKKLELWATYYYVQTAQEIPASKKGIDLLGAGNKKLGIRLTEKEYCLAAIEGTALVSRLDGSSVTLNFLDAASSKQLCDCTKYANVSSKTGRVRFRTAKGPYGDGVSSFRLVPYRTIAVDKATLPIGSVIYIPEARGERVVLPDGSEHEHDGYFFAADVGGKIKGTHIDVFQGLLSSKAFASFVGSSPSKLFQAYRVKDATVIDALFKAHKGTVEPVPFSSSADEVEMLSSSVAEFSVIKRGSLGPLVREWQLFLVGQGIDPKGVDGKFGKDTEAATKRFQKRYHLTDSGVVEQRTWGKAIMLGFPLLAITDLSGEKYSDSWPQRPTNIRMLTHNARVARFGEFKFKHAPKPKNYENVEITDGWDKANLVKVNVPAIAKLTGGYSGNLYLHKDIKDSFLDLWAAWKEEGLLDRLLSWEGMYNSRFKRGTSAKNIKEKNPVSLSNHSWGTAFDVNYRWNRLYTVPALLGEEGCVRELVALANKHGFYWGGHFTKPRDGMHFEAADFV